MLIKCTIEETELDGDYGRSVSGVTATCSRCGHETESYGTGEASRLRCLVLLKEECPRKGNHFYVDEANPPPAFNRKKTK